MFVSAGLVACSGTEPSPAVETAAQTPACVDADGDGFGTGGACPVEDCDDADSAIHPYAAEACDGVDNDCDGADDDDDPDGPSDPVTWYADADADGYGDAATALAACDAPDGYTTDASDCDDGDAAVFPGAAEVDDLADNDCDGAIDEAPSCTTNCDCPAGDLCREGACQAGNWRYDVVEQTWQSMHDRLPSCTASDFGAYPALGLSAFAHAYEHTCDTMWLDDMDRLATELDAWTNEDDLFVADAYGYISRDHTARYLYSLYAAWSATGDTAYLEAADATASAMIDLLERQEYSYGGESYTLFCSTYETTSPYACMTHAWIDDNQNSEVGLVFTLLSSDPASALYGDEIASDIAHDELSAAMAIQTPKGEIPIGDGGWITSYDTLYGSYAAASWMVANGLMQDEDWAAHIELAGDWLSTFSSSYPTSERYWPYYFSEDLLFEEAFYRLPVLHESGALTEDFVDYAFDGLAGANESQFCSITLPFPLYEIAGMDVDALFVDGD